jgi:hypothetical protein
MPTVYGLAVGLVGDGPSVEEQDEQLDGLFERNYAPRGFAWGGVVTDDAVSGRQRFEDRDGAGRLMAAAGRGDVILASEAGFAFRSLSDFAEGVRWLADVPGVSFHAADADGAVGPADRMGEARMAALRWCGKAQA